MLKYYVVFLYSSICLIKAHCNSDCLSAHLYHKGFRQ